MGEKECHVCGEVKPLSDFYRRASSFDGHEHRCKRCGNTRKRQTLPRLVRTRARQRATQDLVRAHREEFRALYEQRLADALDEADRLAVAPESAQTFEPGEPPRLRPGQRGEGQEPVDRIDTAWCKRCKAYHERGHECFDCSPPRWTTRNGTQVAS